MSLQVYLAFVAACIALALLPGPVVTLMIGNGLRYGTRAALTNILGVQAGLAIMIGIVAVGLTSLMATMGYWFDWVRFAGAAYLIWLGLKLIREPVEGVEAEAPPPPLAAGVQSLLARYCWMTTELRCASGRTSPLPRARSSGSSTMAPRLLTLAQPSAENGRLL